MKRNRLFFGFSLIVLSMAVFFIGNRISSDDSSIVNWTPFNTKVVTDSLHIDSVYSLLSKGKCDVNFYYSTENIVVLKYDENNATNNSRIEEGKLILDFDMREFRILDGVVRPEVEIEVYSTSIHTITNIGSGDFRGNDTLHLESMEITNNGVGDIRLRVQADSVVLNNRGVGKISLSGKTQYLHLNNKGVGIVKTKKLECGHAIVDNAGIGKVYVQANDSLSMSNRGVGSISYKGNATIYHEQSSAVGRIHNKN